MVAVTFPEGGSAVVLFTCPLDSSEVTFSDVPCGTTSDSTVPVFEEGGSAVVLFACPLDSSEVTFSDVPCGTTSDSTVPVFELLITLLAEVFCSDVGIGSALMF
jgi:hypothetical protein